MGAGSISRQGMNEGATVCAYSHSQSLYKYMYMYIDLLYDVIIYTQMSFIIGVLSIHQCPLLGERRRNFFLPSKHNT